MGQMRYLGGRNNDGDYSWTITYEGRIKEEAYLEYSGFILRFPD